MNKKQIENEVRKIVAILDSCFPGQQRYDISSRLYLSDVIDDFSLIKENISVSDKQILDIGCGKGHWTALLSKFLKRRIEGIDLVDTFGEGGKYNVENLGQKWQKKAWNEFQRKYDVSYRFYNGKKLPYRDNSFDVLVAYAVIEHVVNEDHFLSECRRVLKKNGKLFIFRCPSKLSVTERLSAVLKMGHHDRLYDARRLRSLLGKSGFEVKQLQKYDTFPAFFPVGKYQDLWNSLYPVNNLFRRILSLPPFVTFAHHFRLVVNLK